MRPITFYLYGNGQTLNGKSGTYDQSIIDHARCVRKQRDESIQRQSQSVAITSRDTEL
jgi:hypothetical protein